MKSDATNSGPAQRRPRRFGGSVLRFVQEHAVLLVLTAFILATAVCLWRLVDSPDLYQAVGNLAIGAYALGLVALALMIRRMRRSQALNSVGLCPPRPLPPRLRPPASCATAESARSRMMTPRPST